jgi:hypothetical protein
MAVMVDVSVVIEINELVMENGPKGGKGGGAQERANEHCAAFCVDTVHTVYVWQGTVENEAQNGCAILVSRPPTGPVGCCRFSRLLQCLRTVANNPDGNNLTKRWHATAEIRP